MWNVQRFLYKHYFNSNSLWNNTCNIGTWSADPTHFAIAPHPQVTLKGCKYRNGFPSCVSAVDSSCLAVYISISLWPCSEFVLILLHNRATPNPLCSAHSQVMRQRCTRSRHPDASGGNSPKVLRVKFSSALTIIIIMKWSCCLDTWFCKSVIACHFICYPW
jgi:hypothetical protein